MSEDTRIAALEGALREQTRLRFEAETRLEILKAEQLSARLCLRGLQATTQALVEMCWALAGKRPSELQDSPFRRYGGYDIESVADTVAAAETELLERLGMTPANAWSEKRGFEERIAAWKAIAPGTERK